MLKVRSLVEERGGVLLEQVGGVDAEHVIRLAECFSSPGRRKRSAQLNLRLLVRTELPPNRYQLFQYR